MPLSGAPGGASGPMGFGHLLPYLRADGANPLLQAQTLGRLEVGSPDWQELFRQGVGLPFAPEIGMSAGEYAANPYAHAGGIDPASLRGGSVVDALLAAGEGGVADTGVSPLAGAGAGPAPGGGQIGGQAINLQQRPPEATDGGTLGLRQVKVGVVAREGRGQEFVAGPGEKRTV